MKKIVVIFITIIILCSVNAVFSMDESIDYNLNLSDNEEIEEIIDKCFTEQALHDFFKFADKEYIPDNYYIKPNLYVKVYHVSDAFVKDLVGSNDYSIKETTIGDKPDIYIPIFSIINDAERVIGHVNLYYSYSKKTYNYKIGVVNCISEEFLERTYPHFLEKIYTEKLIGNVAKDNKLGNVKGTILIELPYAINDFDNKVLLLKTDTGDYAYDLTNTAHSDDVVTDKIYKLNEYCEKRLKYEIENYGTVSDITKVIGGGNDKLTDINNKGINIKIMLISLNIISLMLISIVGITLCFLLVRRHNRCKCKVK